MTNFEDIIDTIKEKPYYLDSDSGIVIYCADCRDILSRIPDGSIDLVLTDPPYGINFTAENYEKHNYKRGTAKVRVTEIMQGDDGNLDVSWLFDYPKFIVWGFPHIKSDKATGWFIWIKREDNAPNPMGNPLEMALSNCWSGFHWKYCLWVGYMIASGEQRFDHPTQKPNQIIEYLLNKYSESDNLILDPFLGSGTTAVCAKKLGRKCIGIEIEKKYCEIAIKRLAQSVMRLDNV